MCGPYSSLKKEILDSPILFADNFFLFSPVSPRLELNCKIPKTTQFCLQLIFFVTITTILRKEYGKSDETENSLSDLEVSLRGYIPFLDLYVC